VKRSRRGSVMIIVGLFAAGLSAAWGQEPSGRRGGRGNGGGSEATRVFLGLGPAPDEAAAKKGEPLFTQYCAGCHGDKGRGAQAPSLVRSVLVLHDEKGKEIGPVIRNGRPQAGMPAFPNFTADDLYNLSEYLHWQVELAANRGTYSTTYSALRNQVTGDAKKGEEFFNGAGGCKNCHSPTGDLAHIGTKFPQPAAMRSRFLWPARQGPVTAKVTLPSGQVVSGRIQHMTDFEVLLTDGSGKVHYWPRADVRVEIEDHLEGHRALLPKYSDDDIHNLTAYLETLK
jgi:cytochrome c oxidase cbb3-type subunit 3